MKLYHTSNVVIREPDIHRGRINADFGQGFYLTPDREFTYRWARDNAIVNVYELDERGLEIHRFVRDEDWFSYIFNNRRVKDGLAADALKLLMIGPEYTQVAIKTQKAAAQLVWISSEKITRMDEGLRKTEKDEYAAAFAKAMLEITG